MDSLAVLLIVVAILTALTAAAVWTEVRHDLPRPEPAPPWHRVWWFRDLPSVRYRSLH